MRSPLSRNTSSDNACFLQGTLASSSPRTEHTYYPWHLLYLSSVQLSLPCYLRLYPFVDHLIAVCLQQATLPGSSCSYHCCWPSWSTITCESHSLSPAVPYQSWTLASWNLQASFQTHQTPWGLAHAGPRFGTLLWGSLYHRLPIRFHRSLRHYRGDAASSSSFPYNLRHGIPLAPCSGCTAFSW